MFGAMKLVDIDASLIEGKRQRKPSVQAMKLMMK
jgi:hypothetical protein